MQKTRVSKIFLSFLPVIVVAILFVAAQIFTNIDCGGIGDCGTDWLWLLLWPLFFVLSIVAVVITGILLIKASRA